MRLADFIEANAETIVSGAETFAASLLPAAAHLNQEELRDHMPVILQAVADDLRTAQTAQQAIRKSEGRAPAPHEASATGAQTHALLRAKGGFGVEQLVGEYRALRASVLRLWNDSSAASHADAFEDMVRFNEAIDQAVAESVAYFTTEMDRWRHLFLGVLGHDLRGPLNTILMTSQLLAKLSTEDPVTQQAARLIRSGERMKSLLDDLLDFNRASLGVGLGVRRTPVDLAQACEEELDLLRSSLPGRLIDYQVDGSPQGSFDASRIREVLANLVLNAAKYGAPDGGILVRLAEKANGVELSVTNQGTLMPGTASEAIFEPLRRGAVAVLEDAGERSNLGLGLFIVREIARAHGGEVDVASTDGQTIFTVRLQDAENGSRFRSTAAR